MRLLLLGKKGGGRGSKNFLFVDFKKILYERRNFEYLKALPTPFSIFILSLILKSICPTEANKHTDDSTPPSSGGALSSHVNLSLLIFTHKHYLWLNT